MKEVLIYRHIKQGDNYGAWTSSILHNTTAVLVNAL